MTTTGWKEWAEQQFGIQNSCKNGCLYCFGTMSDMRFARIENPKDRLAYKPRKAIANPNKKYPGVVAFPNTHDIYYENYDKCEDYLLRLLVAGNKVLIVTKPDIRVIELLQTALREYRDQVEFRITIGSYNSTILKKFEPNASDFEERLSCLKLLFMQGWATSVSIEPYLSRDVVGLISRINPYVSRDIWVGKMNHLNRMVKYVPELEFLRPLYTNVIVKNIHCEIVETFSKPIFHNLIDHIKFKDTFRKIIGDDK